MALEPGGSPTRGHPLLAVTVLDVRCAADGPLFVAFRTIRRLAECLRARYGPRSIIELRGGDCSRDDSAARRPSAA